MHPSIVFSLATLSHWAPVVPEVNGESTLRLAPVALAAITIYLLLKVVAQLPDTVIDDKFRASISLYIRQASIIVEPHLAPGFRTCETLVESDRSASPLRF